MVGVALIMIRKKSVTLASLLAGIKTASAQKLDDFSFDLLRPHVRQGLRIPQPHQTTLPPQSLSPITWIDQLTLAISLLILIGLVSGMIYLLFLRRRSHTTRISLLISSLYDSVEIPLTNLLFPLPTLHFTATSPFSDFSMTQGRLISSIQWKGTIMIAERLSKITTSLPTSAKLWFPLAWKVSKVTSNEFILSLKVSGMEADGCIATLCPMDCNLEECPTAYNLAPVLPLRFRDAALRPHLAVRTGTWDVQQNPEAESQLLPATTEDHRHHSRPTPSATNTGLP